MRTELPTGTVTFLFTDVEGSTKLLHSLGEHAYAQALAEHRRLLREACGRHDGVEVDTQGDAFFFAFGGAADALVAARESIAALEPGPIRVRIGVHTGTPLATDEGYVGVDVHRAARIAASGHGGQVLVSADTAAAKGVDVALVDLGEHRLKDLAAAERIFQLGDATFPPLSTLSASNLPVPATAFLGREQELAALVDMLADPDVRAISVLGPGGIGKTRLAVQAAAEASTGFSGGVWWVALAPLTDPGDTFVELARALGVREQEGVTLDDALHARLEGRRALILLDNAEHLLPAVAAVAAELLGLSSELKVLVTTRERLQLSSEHVFAVPTLAAPDAVAFFRERAAAAGIAVDGTGEVEELCERLDRLPLALQLAAARLRTFSPAQLLDRLTGRLDLLGAGLRDLEPRQQTLRATLEWSHELLSAEEQRLFARLSVFAGSHTLDAAEAVCGADADVLEGIVDKSLVQRRDGPTPRFWMLESIHAFAAEQLNGGDDLRRRHAAYFRELAERMDDELRAGEPEEGPVSVLAAEIDNLRSSVEFGLETADDDLVRTITSSLPMYWIVHGLYSEARAWLDRALALGDDESELQRRLLAALGMIAYQQGDHAVAVEASDAAAALALKLGGVTEQFQLLKDQAVAALRRRDFDEAEARYLDALEVAIAVDNGVGTSACRLNLAYIANKTSRLDRAELLLAENLPFVRSKGQTRCEANTLASIAETRAIYRDRPGEAGDDAADGARRALQIGDRPLAAVCLDVLAAANAARGEAPTAATILASTEAARAEMGVEPDDDEAAIRAKALQLLGSRPDAQPVDLESALRLATGE